MSQAAEAGGGIATEALRPGPLYCYKVYKMVQLKSKRYFYNGPESNLLVRNTDDPDSPCTSSTNCQQDTNRIPSAHLGKNHPLGNFYRYIL